MDVTLETKMIHMKDNRQLATLLSDDPKKMDIITRPAVDDLLDMIAEAKWASFCNINHDRLRRYKVEQDE